jgi:hypothetical protein
MCKCGCSCTTSRHLGVMALHARLRHACAALSSREAPAWAPLACCLAKYRTMAAAVADAFRELVKCQVTPPCLDDASHGMHEILCLKYTQGRAGGTHSRACAWICLVPICSGRGSQLVASAAPLMRVWHVVLQWRRSPAWHKCSHSCMCNPYVWPF